MLELIAWSSVCTAWGSTVKQQHGCVFTCLAMRDIHLEVGFSKPQMSLLMLYVDLSAVDVAHTPCIAITEKI